MVVDKLKCVQVLIKADIVTNLLKQFIITERKFVHSVVIKACHFVLLERYCYLEIEIVNHERISTKPSMNCHAKMILLTSVSYQVKWVSEHNLLIFSPI